MLRYLLNLDEYKKYMLKNKWVIVFWCQFSLLNSIGGILYASAMENNRLIRYDSAFGPIVTISARSTGDLPVLQRKNNGSNDSDLISFIREDGLGINNQGDGVVLSEKAESCCKVAENLAPQVMALEVVRDGAFGLNCQSCESSKGDIDTLSTRANDTFREINSSDSINNKELMTIFCMGNVIRSSASDNSKHISQTLESQGVNSKAASDAALAQLFQHREMGQAKNVFEVPVFNEKSDQTDELDSCCTCHCLCWVLQCFRRAS